MAIMFIRMSPLPTVANLRDNVAQPPTNRHEINVVGRTFANAPHKHEVSNPEVRHDLAAKVTEGQCADFGAAPVNSSPPENALGRGPDREDTSAVLRSA